LYQLAASGPELVFDLRASRVVGGQGDGSPPPELTDVAFDDVRTLESGRVTFALTAENAGFALALPDSTLLEYFCYFPRSSALAPQEVPRVTVSQALRAEGVPVLERTEAVAINRNTREIVAQPRTLRLDDGSVAGSELFVFGGEGGEPVGTFQLARREFAAGGAAFWIGNYLVLGSGPDLYISGAWGEDLVRQVRLDGVEEITGLAVRPDDALLVLDGPHRRLVEIGMEQLEQALGFR
jgi:hypothetical protein